MEKFFNALSKPAKWIFIIGGLFYATWFIIENALSIDGQFVSVIRGLVVLSIGAILIAGAPIKSAEPTIIIIILEITLTN